MLQAGQVEAVVALTEKIGLPDWSHVQVMGSLKLVVPDAQYDDAYNYAHWAIDIFLKERVERIARSLLQWGQLPTQTLEDGQKQAVVPGQTLQIFHSEFTTSLIEVIGLPEKSNTQLFASVKGTATTLIEMDRLYDRLSAQMIVKRTAAVANPRPWTMNR